MKQTQKSLKTQKVECRITEKEKKDLIKKANKLGIPISEYIRQCIFSDNNNCRDNINTIEIITLATEIVRYIEDRCDTEDEWLRKEVVELWGKLQ